MVNIIKETNKILCDVTTNIDECLSILMGQKRDIPAKSDAKPPECIMDDLMQTRDRAALLYEMSCKFRDILNGDERPIPIGECIREPRY